MLVKNIVDEDVTNYKKVSMFIVFPYCSFKCDIESGVPACQNSQLVKEPNKEISVSDIVLRYLNNPLSSAIVLGGLEPFDSFNDVEDLLHLLRSNNCRDEVVIYTGYTEEEIEHRIFELATYFPIIVKYGRFIPNSLPRFDSILGVELASDNQYAKEYR